MHRVCGNTTPTILHRTGASAEAGCGAASIAPGTPLPTPWAKEEFERFETEIQKQRRELRTSGKPEAEMEELFRKEREKEEALFRSEKYAGKVGAFEGANYAAKGYYRPEVDCIMFTRYDKFCAVCRRAIERVIGMYAG